MTESNHHKLISRMLLLLPAVLALIIYACKGSGVSPAGGDLDPDTGGLPGDPYEAVKTIFEGACADCHQEGGPGGLTGLYLDDPERAKELLIGIPSYTNPQLSRVDPGNPAASILYQKVVGTDAGARMPMNGDALALSEIKSIEKWILSVTDEQIVPCTREDSLNASNTRCCDSTRVEAECYVCTTADLSNRAIEKCYQCTPEDKKDPLDTRCFVNCTDSNKLDPLNTDCYVEPIPYQQVQEIFLNSGCTGFCHVVGGMGYEATGSSPDGLTLETDLSHAALMKASFVNSGVHPVMRVLPGSADSSFLFWKISKSNDELAAGGKFNEGEMGKMPPGGSLSEDQIEIIRMWILQGASGQ